MTVLSKDLNADILSRLPTKALCRFKCVCKEWRSIICNDIFFKTLHRERSSQKPFLLFLKDTFNRSPGGATVTISSVDFDENHCFDFTFTLGGDGCVSLYPSKGELICFEFNEYFYVCNPSTQELVKLPSGKFFAREEDGGFGYIKERNEYVLVNISWYESGTECEVLSWSDGCCLKDCSWKLVSEKCPYSLRGFGVLVENVFYWIGYENRFDERNIETIVSFDLVKEEFGTVVLPEDGQFDPAGFSTLVDMKGMLYLVDESEDVSTMDIWLLKDSKNYIWLKKYSIDLSWCNRDMVYIVPLDHEDEKILLDIKYENDASVEWYDVKDDSLERIDGPSLEEWSSCVLHTSGLFSLGSHMQDNAI